ncbi:MAG: thioredoxin family protein, partial [Bdellovibrionales bacterium]
MALTHTPPVLKTQKMPDFKLKNVDGRYYSAQDFADSKALVVMFICNHCPYVKAIEDRLIQLGHDLKKLNVPLVAICSNDAKDYPEDSFENMQKRSIEKSYPFLYLHDEDQSVAKAFGAVCTPDYFVMNHEKTYQYRGRLDDSWKEPQNVTQRELYKAV